MKDDNLNEWLNFSIVGPNKDVKTTRLYEAIHSFKLKVNSYQFANLIEYKDWQKRQILLDIAAKYMNP